MRLAKAPVQALLAISEPTPGRLERWILVVIIFSLQAFIPISIQIVGEKASLPIVQLPWTAAYIYALVGLIIERKRAAVAIKKSLPIIVVVGLILLSTFWSDQPGLTARRAFSFFGTSLIGYYIACRFRLTDFIKCLVMSTGVASILSVIAIVFFRRFGVMQEEYAGAWDGIFGHKNILSDAMVVGVIAAVILMIASKGRRRLAYAALTLLFFGLIVGSRGVTSFILAAAMVAFIASVRLMRSKRFGVPAALALFLVSGIVTIAVLAAGIGGQSMFDLLGRDNSLTGRTDVWQSVMKAIADRPLLGWGYRAFWIADGPASQYFDDFAWIPPNAHNGLLEFWLDIGLVGTTVVIVALLVGIWNGIRLVMRSRDVMALWPLMTMIYVVLSNIDTTTIEQYNMLAWVAFLVAFVHAIPPEGQKIKAQRRLLKSNQLRMPPRQRDMNRAGTHIGSRQHR
jgi:exopolysaccharide production protein ExoQ